jgi:hypothetical protein
VFEKEAPAAVEQIQHIEETITTMDLDSMTSFEQITDWLEEHDIKHKYYEYMGEMKLWYPIEYVDEHGVKHSEADKEYVDVGECVVIKKVYECEKSGPNTYTISCDVGDFEIVCSNDAADDLPNFEYRPCHNRLFLGFGYFMK